MTDDKDKPELSDDSGKLKERELPALGLHDNLPFMEYLRGPGISKHGLDEIHRSPLTYIHNKRNPPPTTPAMIIGSALHCLVLEPDKFDSEYVADKFNGSRAKAALEWQAEQIEKGLTVISTRSDESKGVWGASDWDRIHRMADSVHNHAHAAELLDGASTELTAYWIAKLDYEAAQKYKKGRLCKMRLDAYNREMGLPIDLKSANDATYSGFARAVHDYRYDVQDAWYTYGCGEVDLPVYGFWFIVVEKTPPYQVACYQIPPKWRREGTIKAENNFRTYLECINSDEWPGYPPMRDLDMPTYARFNKIS